MKGRGLTEKRILSMLLAAALSLAGCGGSGAQEDAAQTSAESESPAEDADAGTEADGYRTVLWQGEVYTYNDHLSNFLFLGVDRREPAETEAGHADAGQADALYLLSYDRAAGDLTLISIPRDTMTPLEVFAYGGESLGLTEQHISLSYAYGDGSYGSLDLAETAVSSLFYGLPVQSACAMSMDGIPALLESFGEVTVTVPNDSLEEYPEYREGEEAVLTPENAETFLRWRDTNQAETALSRMERQQAFLQAFGETAKSRYAGNPEGLLKIYESLSPYLVSTIGNEWFLRLAESWLKGGTVTEWTVPGEAVREGSFEEYHVDDSAFYGLILDTFYEKEGS